MFNTLPRVFVSATSQDLGSYRLVVRDGLLTAGIHPVLQDHFPPDYREISEMLRDKIRPCDAVICLVGNRYGAAPTQTADTPRSYTQLEYFIARELGKTIYLLMAAKTCAFDPVQPEPADRAALQLRFREDLETGAQQWTAFSSREELATQVAHLVRSLRPASGESVLDLHPATAPAYFAGRLGEVEQLTAAAKKATPGAIAVIGVGGQGKTTLVSHWLNLPSRPKFDALFRCTAYRGGYTFDNFLDDALGFLMEEIFEKRDFPTIAARSRKLLELMQRRRILLVVDGIERWLCGWNAGRGDLHSAELPGDRNGYYDGLDEFLSNAAGLASGSHLLVTTRALPHVLDGAACAMVPVDENGRLTTLQGLEDQAAIELLQRLGVGGETAAILRVANSYYNHPLALTVLGSMLSKRYGGRLERLDCISAFDARERLAQLFGELHVNLPNREAAARLLQVAGHCLENPSLAVLAAGMGDAGNGPAAAHELLDLAVSLADWNVLQWDGVHETVILHPLIKEYFSRLATDSSAIHRRLSAWYGRQPIVPNAASMHDAGGRFLAIEHALRGADLRYCVELVFSPLTPHYTFVEWLSVWGHLTAGVALLHHLASAADGDDRCQFLIPRGALLRSLGQLDAARTDLDAAIAILSGDEESASLGKRIKLANAYTNRGNVYRQAREFPPALADYDQALAVAREVAKQYQPAELHVARALANRGNVLAEIGHLSTAMTDFDSAIRIYESLRANQQDVTAALANVRLSRANALGEKQLHAEAIAEYDQIIAAYQELIASGQEEFRPQWAHAQTMRGVSENDSGKHEEALQDFDRAANELFRLVQMGRRDIEDDLALAWMNRGLANGNLKQWHDALRDCDRAVETFERLTAAVRGALNGWLAHCLLNRSETLQALGDIPAAARDRHRGFEVFREAMRKGHPGGIVYLRKLLRAVIQMLDSEPVVSLRLLDEALTYAERIFDGPDSSEAFARQLHRGLDWLHGIRNKLEVAGCDWARINSLRQRLDQWYDRQASPLR